MKWKLVILLAILVMLVLPVSAGTQDFSADWYNASSDGYYAADYQYGGTGYRYDAGEESFSDIRTGEGTGYETYPTYYLNLTAGATPDTFTTMSRPAIFVGTYWPYTAVVNDAYISMTVDTYSTLGDFTLGITSGTNMFKRCDGPPDICGYWNESVYQQFNNVMLSDTNVTITSNGTHTLIFKLNQNGINYIIQHRELAAGIIARDYSAEIYPRLTWDIDNNFGGEWASGGTVQVTFTGVDADAIDLLTWDNVTFSEPTLEWDMFATNGTQISPPWPVKFWDISGLTNASSYYWIFGDGGTSTERNPVHWYTSTGVFNVTFRIVDTNSGVYQSTKVGYVFSRKNDLPVPFDGISDEFDIPASILLYNGTYPIADHWQITTDSDGRGILNSTGVFGNLSVEGQTMWESAIFYGPSWLNGSSQLQYKFPPNSTYTWNFIKPYQDCSMHYLFTQTDGMMSPTYDPWPWQYNQRFPPQFADRNFNITQYSSRLFWLRTQDESFEIWMREVPGLRARIVDIPILSHTTYHNWTVKTVSTDPSNPRSDTGTLYVDNIELGTNIWSEGVGAQYGYAGIDIENDMSGIFCTAPEIANTTAIMIDNWSFNYQDAPEAAFTVSSYNGTSADAIQFTDSSLTQGFPATGWYWEFGDGQTSWEQNPSHKYDYGGQYHVNFRVATDEGFDWILDGATINVTQDYSFRSVTIESTAQTIQMIITLGILLSLLAVIGMLVMRFIGPGE